MIAMKIPIIQRVDIPASVPLMPKKSTRPSATELACTMLPMPRAATAVKKANNTARNFHLFPNPSSIKYIGPPRTWPSGSIRRYITARVHEVYLTAMPKTAVTHIQKSAPGPPMAIAVATPVIFPVPMVADKAADSA